MFWKLFFALWLSIMAFAVVVSWINQTLILDNEIQQPAEAFRYNLDRSKARLARDLQTGGEREAVRTLRRLPRGVRNHIYVQDASGRELLNRENLLKRKQQGRVKFTSEQFRDSAGRVYTITGVERIPPRGLLSPGPAGVGLRLLVAAVISALISLILARYLAAPLGLLSRASRQLATGDLSVRLGAPLDQRRDEFGQLALDLDEMARRLQISQQANQRLLRDVSHELRSPLARLRVALEIARNKDDNLVQEELNRIELESERLEKLIDEVLGLLRESSGSGTLKLSSIDLAELLQDLVETVNYEMDDKRQPIELRLRPPLVLDADHELLWRAFENLLRNALVHSGATGAIQIDAGPAPADEIQVRVLDTGPGIPEVHLERIFEPFYRVDEARDRRSGGHGLGLAIAASAVRRHGGRISASNRPGSGLVISVMLPRHRAA